MKCKTEVNGNRQGSLAGLTMIELLSTMAALAVLLAVGMTIWGGIKERARAVEFRSHVKMLNGAVDVYRANAGDLGGALSGEQVIAKLKTLADKETARTINGLRGGVLDLRLRGIMQSSAEAASSQKRAVWVPERMRFEVMEAGQAGFNRFVLDDSATVAAAEVRTASLALASSGGWVWDYSDNTPESANFAPPVSGVPGEVEPPDGGGYPKILPLNPPEYSIPGGTYEYANFDLPLTLLNPNPNGVSQVFYSIDGGTWTAYSGGEIMVGPGAIVSAYAVSIDPDSWTNSEISQEAYDSSFVITGNTSGLFSNPVGGPDMVTGGWGNYFTWGTPATWAGFTDPSWVLYEGASFLDVLPDERFLLGSIEYYNGTIAGGTGANGLDLSIELSFGGSEESELFEYDLNLINTANLEGNTEEESADYVQFGNIYAEVPATLGGVEYMLIIEFGETTEHGFSTIDEFHVHEGESATGQLYGTLMRAWGEG